MRVDIDVMKMARNLLHQCEIGQVTRRTCRAANCRLVAVCLESAELRGIDTRIESARLRRLMEADE